MKKILVIGNEFPPLGGGTANEIFFTLREFQKRKNLKIDLLTASTGDFRVEHFSKNIRIFFLDIGKREKNFHFQTVIELLRFSIKSFWRGFFLFRKEKYDGIFCFSGVPAGAIGFFLSKFFRAPFVVRLQGSDVPFHEKRWEYFDRFFFQFFSPKMWRAAAAVEVNSSDLAREAQKVAPRQKFFCVSNGVDGDFFHPDFSKKKKGKIIILGVGRLNVHKNFDRLFLAADPKKMEIWLAGDGPERKHLEKLARQKKIFATFFGEISKKALAQKYQNADLFVLPSTREGMSNALLEAMASGLPVMASDTGGAKNLIDEQNGILLKKNTVAALRAAFQKITKNPKMLEKMGKNSRKKAEKFSWKAAADAHFSLFFPKKKKQKVAFLARGMTPGGVSRFFFHLLKSSQKWGDRAEILVFHDETISRDFREKLPFVTFCFVAGGGRGIFQKLFWDHFAVVAALKKEKPDAIVYPKTVIPFFHARLPAKKFSVVHDLGYFEKSFRVFPRGDTFYMRKMMPRSFQKADHIFAVSNFVAADLKKKFSISPQKITTIFEAADEKLFGKRFSATTKKEILKKYHILSPFFLFCAEFSPRKNLIAALDAFEKIKSKIPHSFVIAGAGGWENQHIKSRLAAAKKSGRIFEIGFVSDDLPILYAAADFFLFPSLYEGFGLPIVEAQISGCPVITSKTTSCGEIAGDGALLVNPKKVDEIADAILKMVTDRDFREKMRQKGKKKAATFSWEKTADRVFQKIIQ